ncbi:MAG TPA: phosphoglucosamine mutase [Streptosporangiaceae bacterium]|jgi:phosphoglucosamine mutase
MARLFGTDGVRGVAGRDLTAHLALDLSIAAAHILGEAAAGRRPRAVVGRDPRASGEFLEAAVVAGLAGAGVDVLRLGVVPTPGVAYLTEALGVDLGVMLSASHNPAPDNGIKFFARGGRKLADDVEDRIEAQMGHYTDEPTGSDVGRVFDAHGEIERYVGHLLTTLPGGAAGRVLDGLRVVVDCANGAASVVAPEALRRAGADVVAIAAEPDGLNINAGCGSTHPEALQKAVVAYGADAGIAHDGDADRCLAVTGDGELLDGDQIMAILALDMHRDGRLPDDTVVATVMSNLGFKIAMRDAGLRVVETAVGDRYVLEAMQLGGYALGGEQSGHVVMADHSTTGDGALTALHLLAAVARSERSIGELASTMTRLPQVLVNVRGVDKRRASACPALDAAVNDVEIELGDTGRVLIRPSGTEPMVRVMVEAPTEEEAASAAERLAGVVRSELG